AVSVSVTNGTGFTWQGAGTNASGFTSTATDVASTTGNIQETLTATTAANGTVTYTVTPTNGTNGSGATCVGTAQTHTVTVTPSVTPSVSISASKTTICEGESVTFTASPTNGGASPGYQWKVNGNNAGTNSATFSSTTLSNNDVVTVEMTSDASCPDPATVTSNQITMTVEPVGTASVTISASETLICKGASITFTPTPVNGGTPTYQWLVNNSVVETNSSTFTSSTLNDGDEVKAIMTASGTCVTGSPAESNAITINVTEPLTPSVVIASNATNNEICSGQEVTFTATPTNGGTPTYQWKLNGSNVGTGATYTNNSLSQGDEIEVEMTTSETCVTSTTATSNTITMTVTGTVIPKVTITSNETTICEGEEVIFTATPENGGTSPSYQWMVNGVNAGTDSPTFSSSALTNGAQVTVVLTSSLGCASPNTATSSPVTITVNPNVTASVSITGNNSICEGSTVTFTATANNGGTSPSYQWKVNGNNEGTNSNQFSSSTLQNGDVVTVEMTSNATCITGSPATSNPITMSVAAKQAPSVSITATATTICSGQSVTFSATPINGGASPSYQWLVNGTPVTGSGITYTSTSLANEDEVWVEMTTSETCVTTSSPVSSNKIKINVTQTETPTVTIAEINNKTNICGGESLTFKATPNSSETNPVYQWQINGSPTGGNTDEFTSNSLQNGDVVTVILTSSLSCASSPTATSNPITLTVTNPVTATAQITGVNEFCKGEQITFTSNTTNEGSAPTYLWKVNNVVVGNGPTYTSNNLGNGDIIILELQSNATCVTNPTTSSNAITVTVKEPIVITDPLVSTSVCDGSTLNLTISATGSGPISYQWYFEGGIMAGETNSILSIPNVNSTHEGTYKVEISSSCGTKASQGFVAVNPSVDVTKQVEGSKICFNGDPTVVVRNSQHNVSYIAYNASNQALNNPVLGNGQDLTLNLNISGLSPGSNTITIKALAGGCGNANLTQKATVIILDEVSNEDLIGPLSICNDNLANIPFHISQVAGATSYIWYVGSAELAGQTQNAVNITFDKAQFTNVTVIPLLDGISCSSASIVVEQVPAYDGSAFLSVNEDTICEGNEITFKLENISPGTVVWSALPDFSHEITGNKISKTIRFDAAGTYIIRLAFEHPCNGTIPLEKEITVIATPVANAGSDIKLEDFATVVLDGSASTQGNLYTALWTSSDPSSEISRPFSLITAVVPKSVKTTYFLTITSTNEASCSAFDEVNVEIDLLVKVPNIFSPNGDGIHDYLMVNNIELFPNAVMYIYNQWGQEVYRSSPGYKDPWDGTKGGKPVPVSTYYYVLELNEEDFGPIKGSVTIVK
ncbi:MAG TPA: immunoglobulin domain-containing protein, partial [Cytophagaceae bacterium]